ncbi:MAG: alpha/beta hydrolase fold domain-containing protein [Oscillospiraceae bacterium]|nr:alpha/beta hydrolase fold domain-containing protein [Oscillospiraceae bacterium]
MKKVLTAYYRTKKTYENIMHDPQFVAQLVQEKAGGDLINISEETPDLNRYNIAFIGWENMYGHLPQEIAGLLAQAGYKGEIVLFLTVKGDGLKDIVNEIKALQPEAVMNRTTMIAPDAVVRFPGLEVGTWVRSMHINVPYYQPERPADTLAAVPADKNNQQVLYIWEQDNMPAFTEYTNNDKYYYDAPGFRPYTVTYPVPEGVPVKGAMVICPGGAFMFRSEINEGEPVAIELAKLGYHSFVVNYRVEPYKQEEGATDVARVIRYIRKYAHVYGIDPDNIGVMGFSAGGIQAGEMLLNFAGGVTGTKIDKNYIPDELDSYSANCKAAGMIYSFYGWLSVASRDVEKLASANLPDTYYCYGTEDPFVDEFKRNIETANKAGVNTECLVLDGRPHGYGYTEGWIPHYDKWLTKVFDK